MSNSNFLRETIDLVKSIETRFIELGARLYKIREEKLWIELYDSYPEFLDATHINPGLASMLASVYKNYVIDGHLEPERLAGIGYSNLYQAIPLIGADGIDVAVVKAKTLTRNEIIDEVRDERHGVHTHEVDGDARFGVCKCGKFVKLHETV